MNLAKLRSHRIFGMAIFDLVLALIGTIVLFVIAQRVHFKKLNPWHFVIAAILLTIPIGIASHVLFGVNTSLNYRLGLSYKPKN